MTDHKDIPMLTHSLRAGRLLTGVILLVASITAIVLTPDRSAALLGSRLAIIKVGTPPPQTPGAREFSVNAGQGVDVVVQSQDVLFNPSPLSLLQSKQIRLTTTGPDAASFSYTKTLPAGQSSVTFTNVKWNTPYDGVVLTAEVVGGGATPDTATGNVLEVGATVPANTEFWSFDGSNVAFAECTATKAIPVCIEMRAQFSTTDQLLGLAPCDTTQGCVPGSDIATWLAGVDPTKVTATNPNTLTLKLDKTIAGQRGVSQFQLVIQLVPDGPFEAVPPCPTATTVGVGQKFCEAGRNADNAGDRIFHINWLEDGRIVIK